MLGLAGWQWLFLVEGIPAILLGVIVLAYLTDRPEAAHWLSSEEKEWVVSKLAVERASRGHSAPNRHRLGVNKPDHLAARDYLSPGRDWILWLLVLGTARRQIADGK